MLDLELNQNIASLLQCHASDRPDDVAFVCNDVEVTWKELDERSNCVANGLLSQGTVLGSRVSYLGKNSERYFDVLYGVSKAGCVLVPINWRLAPPEVHFILQDSEAVVLFIDADFLPLLAHGVDDLSYLRLVVVVDSDAHDDPSLNTWKALYEPECPTPNSGSDDIVIQLYTSGTTGTPKGAELSNRFFLEAVKLLRNVEGGVYAWDANVVALIPTPLFHMSGIIYGVLALVSGCKSILLNEFDPDRVLKLVDQEPIRVLPTVPATVQMLLDHPLAETTDFSQLSFIAYGASPMPPVLLRRAIDKMGCEFFQGYGMTESAIATALPPADHSVAGNKRMASVGKPLSTVELRIVDEDDRDVRCGEVGEIIFRSPALLSGYWKKEAATAEAMRGGYFHTGDAAYQDEDGYVYLKDRIKDKIISGGENIYPAEVENALHEHPDVQDVAVVGVPDERWGEAPKAFIVATPGAVLNAEELRHFVGKRIAKFKIPRYFEAVDALPRTASGKVLRRELRLSEEV